VVYRKMKGFHLVRNSFCVLRCRFFLEELFTVNFCALGHPNSIHASYLDSSLDALLRISPSLRRRHVYDEKSYLHNQSGQKRKRDAFAMQSAGSGMRRRGHPTQKNGSGLIHDSLSKRTSLQDVFIPNLMAKAIKFGNDSGLCSGCCLVRVKT
jgi:hypothetical protein